MNSGRKISVCHYSVSYVPWKDCLKVMYSIGFSIQIKLYPPVNSYRWKDLDFEGNELVEVNVLASSRNVSPVPLLLRDGDLCWDRENKELLKHIACLHQGVLQDISTKSTKTHGKEFPPVPGEFYFLWWTPWIFFFLADCDFLLTS